MILAASGVLAEAVVDAVVVAAAAVAVVAVFTGVVVVGVVVVVAGVLLSQWRQTSCVSWRPCGCWAGRENRADDDDDDDDGDGDDDDGEDDIGRSSEPSEQRGESRWRKKARAAVSLYTGYRI